MPLFAQAPPTNRTLLDSCVQTAIREAAKHWGLSRMDAIVDSSRDAALISAPFYRAMSAMGGNGDGRTCRARVSNAETKYRTIGDDRIVRTVAVNIMFEVRSPRIGPLEWAGETGGVIEDTLRCGDIAFVERGEGIPAAHAPDPCLEESSLLSSLVAPVVLAVASATIVILLFTIRGQ